MANVWKIGAWPGFPGTKYSLKNKNDFIHKHALLENYVAIGWADCDAKVDEHTFRSNCAKCKPRCKENVISQIVDFTLNIKPNDIVLLYNRLKVYTGKVVSNYYPNTALPKHRIGVEWLFNKQSKDADFRLWQDTVHKVSIEDLDNVTDEELKLFLVKQLRDYDSNNVRKDEEEQADLVEHYSQISEKEIISELANLKPEEPETVTVMQKLYKRDNRTIAQLKILRNFKCQICGTAIQIRGGKFYAEGAHIISKSRMGNELPSNILILCPNHHKEFDLSNRVIHNHNQDHIIFEMNNKIYDINLSILSN
jgi:HNH endonuclease